MPFPASAATNSLLLTFAPTPEQLRRDDSLPWREITTFGAGRTHTFRVKTLAAVLMNFKFEISNRIWKKAAADQPLRMAVIAPLGQRPRTGSKPLYRQPAYLICTDPDLPLDQLI